MCNYNENKERMPRHLATEELGKSQNGMQIILLDLNKIVLNKNNTKYFEYSDIDAFALNILTCGLKNPITVRQIPTGEFEVIDGGRRVKAVRELKDSGKSYNFVGKKLNGEIPARVIDNSEGFDEFEELTTPNVHRSDSGYKARTIILEWVRRYQLESEVEKSKYKGIQHYLKVRTGFSDRTIRKHVDNSGNVRPESVQIDKSISSKKNDKSVIVKRISDLSTDINNIKAEDLSNYNISDLTRALSSLKTAVNELLKIVKVAPIDKQGGNGAN